VQVGDQIVANVSPAFQDNSTSRTIPIGIKAVPAAVVGEPLLSTLSFNLFVGQLVTNSFAVSNYTSAPVTITGVSTGNSAVTVSSSPIGTSLAANGGSSTIVIQASSAMPQNYSGNIQIATSGGNASYPYSVTSRLISINTSGFGNGTISSSTTTTYQQNVEIVLTPSSGYILGTLLDNGSDVTSAAGFLRADGTYRYTVSNVTSDRTISASFKLLTPSVTVPAVPAPAEILLMLGLAGCAVWVVRRRRVTHGEGRRK